MTDLPPYATIQFAPQADPAAIVQHDYVRFSVLTSRLIRLEYCPDGRFEDRPSQTFWYRHQPVPEFEVERTAGRLIITTQSLCLEYRFGEAGFSADNLSIRLLPNGPVWHFGQADSGNLRGTTRTLDKVNGRTSLDPGLLSRDGWVVVDDSASLVFNEAAWLEARGSSPGAMDLYFFGYGQLYRDCLRDYCRLSGSPPLLPRWALGNWWSRYWAYRDHELWQLMTDFREHEVPLSVCIIDMDWHLVDVGEGINGWTGYTWNNNLFPDPEAFIAWLREQGLRTALNLHPALGVRPHEAMYAEMAARLRIDPATQATIPFDIADPAFAAAYFEVLHHPQEAIGVDFWWIDWQQGTRTRVGGLDPLWWLNHLHFYDLGRADKRSFIFSRWGGLGNHRYPIGFSGDTIVSWETLAFQPYFTATAANVAYGWWSHDIGGHMQGIEDPELYARWVQFGVFSPILRLHSTNNPFHERRPWAYNAEVFRITREAMQLRHALIPYLYTMSRLDEVQNQALVRPMYHDYPDRAEAYVCPQQYLFGTELIAAPYTAPADPDTRLARQVFWLPPGDWYHFVSGEYYAGDAWHTRYGSLSDIPVFARAGGIVPMGPQSRWGGIDNPEELQIHLFAGADGRFTLYEDDGYTRAYQQGAFALTTIAQRWEPTAGSTQLKVTISPVAGDISVLPKNRRYLIDIIGISEPIQFSARVNGTSQDVDYHYDTVREACCLCAIALDRTDSLQIVLTLDDENPLARRDRTQETLLAMLSVFRLETGAKARLASRLSQVIQHPLVLAEYGLDLTDRHVKALIEITQGVGYHHLTHLGEPHLLVLWNNQNAVNFRRVFLGEEASIHKADRLKTGAAPRFESYCPADDRWRLTVDYFGLFSDRIQPNKV